MAMRCRSPAPATKVMSQETLDQNNCLNHGHKLGNANQTLPIGRRGWGEYLKQLQ